LGAERERQRWDNRNQGVGKEGRWAKKLIKKQMGGKDQNEEENVSGWTGAGAVLFPVVPNLFGGGGGGGGVKLCAKTTKKGKNVPTK